MNGLVYEYDGSWAGLLSCVFEAFERRENPSAIQQAGTAWELYAKQRVIPTDEGKAQRVVKKIKQCSPKTFRRLLKAHLSETKHRELLVLKVIRLLLKNPTAAENDYGSSEVLRLKQIEKTMNREIHRMHAFVRFQKGKDNRWYAFIRPDFDVLPLIGDHFEDRYADQEWIIFDLKREYGLHYDLQQTNDIRIDFFERIKDGKLPIEAMDEQEKTFQQLWRNYFQSVNINERNNPKLHLRHVPKRYWNLLTEK